MSAEIKRIINGYDGVIMHSQLKLFLDGTEVKSGDALTRDDIVITFDYMTLEGEIVDKEGHCFTVYKQESESKTWKFYKEPKKYSPAIFATKKDGKIINYYLDTFIHSEKPPPYNGSDTSVTQIVYWPASDYYKDGYFVLPE